MELVYIQDITKIRDGETAIGVSCPPLWRTDCRSWRSRLSILGGGAVEPVNVRVWELHLNRGSVNRMIWKRLWNSDMSDQKIPESFVIKK